MNDRNLVRGLFLLAVSLAFGLASLRYPMGQFSRAGPGRVGYMFLRLGLDAAPLMLGFIPGPMLEENFCRALLLSRGNFTTFVTRPISGALLALISVFIVWQLAAFFLQARQAAAPPRQPA